MRFGGRVLLRGKRFKEDPGRGLSPGKKAVGSVPAPRSRRPQPSGTGVEVGAGGHATGSPRLGRRGETWPKESDSGTFRNSRRPGAFGRPSTPARLQVPRGHGPRWAGLLAPRAVGARLESGKARHVADFLLAPYHNLRAPPFLDQVQARAPPRAAHPLPHPLPSPPPPSIPHHLASSLFLCLFPTT